MSGIADILIRRATPDDAEGILKAHRDAVYAKGTKHYTPEQIADWAAAQSPERIASERLKLADPAVITHVAEYKGAIVGFCMVIPAKNELGAVYVAPGPWRGVGSKLLAKAEVTARELHVEKLSCDSSLNAEDFYRKHGFEFVEYTMHRMKNGGEVSCVKMTKRLAP
jgi:N-acetylglutamate synthase-like GNAT family acetyltransferase